MKFQRPALSQTQPCLAMPTFINPSRLPLSSSSSSVISKKSMPAGHASPAPAPPAAAILHLPAADSPPRNETDNAFITYLKSGENMPQLQSASAILAIDDPADLNSDLREVDKVHAFHIFDKKHKNFRDVVSRMKRKLPSQPAGARDEQSRLVECSEIESRIAIDGPDCKIDYGDGKMDFGDAKMDFANVQMDLDDRKHEIEHHGMEHRGSKVEDSCQSHNRYRLGDMVWGKVKSHPWWPGQVFDPALACSLARKTKRDGHVLVAFFGDGTFGWFQESELIPFESNFLEMAKQTTAPNFVLAVEDALDEIRCRFRSGLACSCANAAEPKHQDALEKPAKRRKKLNLDKHLSAVRKSFEPTNFLSSVKEFASAPLGSSRDLLYTTKVAAQAFAFRAMSFTPRDSRYQEFLKRFLEFADYNRRLVNSEESLPADSPELSDWREEQLVQAHARETKQREPSDALKSGLKLHSCKVQASQKEGQKKNHDKGMPNKVFSERSADCKLDGNLIEHKKGFQEKRSDDRSKSCRLDDGSMKHSLNEKDNFKAGGLQDGLETNVKNVSHAGFKRPSEDGLKEGGSQDSKGKENERKERKRQKQRSLHDKLGDDSELARSEDGSSTLEKILGSQDFKGKENERKERKRLKQRRWHDKLRDESESVRSEDGSSTLEKNLDDVLPSEKMASETLKAESHHSHVAVKNLKRLKRLVKSEKYGIKSNSKSVPQSGDSISRGFQASKGDVTRVADDVLDVAELVKEHHPGSAYGGKERLKGGDVLVVIPDAISKNQEKHTEVGDVNAYPNMVSDPLTDTGSENLTIPDKRIERGAAVSDPSSQPSADAFNIVNALQLTSTVNAIADGACVVNGMTLMPLGDVDAAMMLERQVIEDGGDSFANQMLEPSQSMVAKADKETFQRDVPVGESVGVAPDSLRRKVHILTDVVAKLHRGKSSLQTSAKFRRLVKGPKVSNLRILDDTSSLEKGISDKSILGKGPPDPESEITKRHRKHNGEHPQESAHTDSLQSQEAQECHRKKAEVEKTQQRDSPDRVDGLQKLLKELLYLAVDHFSVDTMETISKVLKFKEAVYQGGFDRSDKPVGQGISDIPNEDANLDHRVEQTSPPSFIAENLNIDSNEVAVSEVASPRQGKQNRLHKDNLNVSLEKTKTSVLSSAKKISPSSISLRPIPDTKLPLRPLKQSHKQVNSSSNNSSKFTSENDKISSSLSNNNLLNEPAALCMKFPQGFALPSEAQLRAIFVRFGSLSSSGTRVNCKTGSAQVVFRRASDAETALKYVQENNVFGQISVRYMVKQIHIAKETLESQPARDSSERKSKLHDERLSPMIIEKQDGNVKEEKPFGKSVIEHTRSQGTLSLKSCLKKIDDTAGIFTKNAAHVTFQGRGVELEHLLSSASCKTQKHVNNDLVIPKTMVPTSEGLGLSAASLNTCILTSLPNASHKTSKNLNSKQLPSKQAGQNLDADILNHDGLSLSASSLNAGAPPSLPNAPTMTGQSLNTGILTPTGSSLSTLDTSKSSVPSIDIGDQMLCLLQRVSALVGSSGGFVL